MKLKEAFKRLKKVAYGTYRFHINDGCEETITGPAREIRRICAGRTTFIDNIRYTELEVKKIYKDENGIINFEMVYSY